MIAKQRQYFAILLFIYLLFRLSQFAISQHSWNTNFSHLNSTGELSSLWINRPYSTDDFYGLTPILLGGNAGPRFLCGSDCNYNGSGCFLGVLLFPNRSNGEKGIINLPQLVWSANQNHPVKANATLQLGRDGNLVLADFDGTLVWSTNTTGKSVSGLNLTERGNLVLFDKRKRTIWQSFDHPTDCLLPGQKLVSGRKLTTTISSTNHSFSFTVLRESLVTSIDTDPPQYYMALNQYDAPGSPYYDFDGRTFTVLQDPYTSGTQFLKLGPDGHIRVYQWDAIAWEELSEVLSPDLGNCGYPMVCGRYSICTNNGQCNCPPEENFFRPINRNPDLGCSQLTEVNCDSSRYHSFVELKDTVYFAFKFSHELSSSIFWLEGKKLEECKRACLSNCSCKAAVFENDWDSNRIGSCLLLNEVFSLIDNEGGRGKTIYLKVQNSSKALNQSPIILEGKKSRPFKVIIGSTLAVLFGIILSISTCFVLFKKRTKVPQGWVFAGSGTNLTWNTNSILLQ